MATVMVKYSSADQLRHALPEHIKITFDPSDLTPEERELFLLFFEEKDKVWQPKSLYIKGQYTFLNFPPLLDGDVNTIKNYIKEYGKICQDYSEENIKCRIKDKCFYDSDEKYFQWCSNDLIEEYKATKLQKQREDEAEEKQKLREKIKTAYSGVIELLSLDAKNPKNWDEPYQFSCIVEELKRIQSPEPEIVEILRLVHERRSLIATIKEEAEKAAEEKKEREKQERLNEIAEFVRQFMSPLENEQFERGLLAEDYVLEQMKKNYFVTPFVAWKKITASDVNRLHGEERVNGNEPICDFGLEEAEELPTEAFAKLKEIEDYFREVPEGTCKVCDLKRHLASFKCQSEHSVEGYSCKVIITVVPGLEFTKRLTLLHPRLIEGEKV